MLDLGVKALGMHPVKSLKNYPGEVGMPVNFGGVEFVLGWWVDSNEDGILVSEVSLHHHHHARDDSVKEEEDHASSISLSSKL